MAFVIAEPCAECKKGSCVAICPVDAIHPGIVEKDGQRYDQLFIDPDLCISCGLCEGECPIDAIFEEDALPAKWQQYVSINAEFYK